MNIRKKRNKKIDGTNFEKLGGFFSNLFSKASERIGLNKLGKRIETWANQHKKATFGIIMSFLSLGVLIILTTSIISFVKPQNGHEVKMAIDTLSSKTRNTYRMDQQVDDYLIYKQYQEEVQSLMLKDSLTHRDSLRLLQIYDEITEYEIKSYYNGKNKH